jgi:hypothetical protein
VAQQVVEINHVMDFKNVKIIDRGQNYHKRLFLEAWHSERNANAGNDRNDPLEFTIL